MACEYCEQVNGTGKGEVLYQDDDLFVVVKDSVLTPGQITVFPREHSTIMELIPDKVLEKCAVVVNKVSIAVFDGLGAGGTNILVQNGISAGQKTPHFAIEIIPRQENDNLNLQWDAKPLMEDEIESTLLALKDALDSKPVQDEPEQEEKPEQKGDNYMIKQLNRLP